LVTSPFFQYLPEYFDHDHDHVRDPDPDPDFDFDFEDRWSYMK